MSNNNIVTREERFTGRVKWFNNKAGYGFITVTDGSKAGTDIFVHHSTIKVDSEQYKYLVQGEYVEFNLCLSESGDHEYQSSNVSGIKGGKLMCETRNDVRSSKFTKSPNNDVSVSVSVSETKIPRSIKVRSEPKDFTKVSRSNKTNSK